MIIDVGTARIHHARHCNKAIARIVFRSAKQRELLSDHVLGTVDRLHLPGVDGRDLVNVQDRTPASADIKRKLGADRRLDPTRNRLPRCDVLIQIIVVQHKLGEPAGVDGDLVRALRHFAREQRTAEFLQTLLGQIAVGRRDQVVVAREVVRRVPFGIVCKVLLVIGGQLFLRGALRTADGRRLAIVVAVKPFLLKDTVVVSGGAEVFLRQRGIWLMKNKRRFSSKRFFQLRHVLCLQAHTIGCGNVEPAKKTKARKGDGVGLVGAEDLRLGAHVVVPVGADAHAERRAAHAKQHHCDDGAEKVIHQKMQREPRRVLPRQASFLHSTPPSELNHTEHSVDTLIIYSKCRFVKREMKNRPKKTRNGGPSVFGALFRLTNSRASDILSGGKQEVFMSPS